MLSPIYTCHQTPPEYPIACRVAWLRLVATCLPSAWRAKWLLDWEPLAMADERGPCSGGAP